MEVNTAEGWVKVQPGVVRDELNKYLAPMGFMFGPETSTANRAMIGGMIGNNSCGSNSVVYGSTRENLISVNAILSDNTKTDFKPLSHNDFLKKIEGETTSGALETQIYSAVYNLLNKDGNAKSIIDGYPDKKIPRRNTGYALDILLDSQPFDNSNSKDFNFCKLIAGSEGTLAFITEAKLKIVPLPPKHVGLICIHFNSVYESLLGNLEALKFNPSASELMDNYILECTKENINQLENRFFVEGDPAAILVVELKRESLELLEKDRDALIELLKSKNLGYHFPFVTGEDIAKVWNLRKAGLGLLSNIPGDAKPVPVIEDTAVNVKDLPEYIKEFNEVLKGYNLFCVHYAHAGSGELHLRPIINLKTEEGNKLFKQIAFEIAKLVKKYKGSLSGEHGDGRLRGEFIPFMIGDKNYKILEEIKTIWDPKNIFNPGKIVNTPAMNSSLRYTPGEATPEFDTAFRYKKFNGYLRSIEQCNGSGDCRKTELSGGTMCPSYMATKNESDTTRARANLLREILKDPELKPFDSSDAVEILDLCISCKGCKSECPSNVDMARIKAEYLNQYYKTNRPPLKTRLTAKFAEAYKLGTIFPALFNLGLKGPIGSITKKVMGIAPQRQLPLLVNETVFSWYKKTEKPQKERTVFLYCDEFTNYNDAELGKQAIQLLRALNYNVIIERADISGRTAFSKGFLSKAKKNANDNVLHYSKLINKHTPLIGIEPSAILSFRDEYPDIVDEPLTDEAKKLSKNVLLFEEFIASEVEKGVISKEQFNQIETKILIHGHCHQKALSNLKHSQKTLSLVSNTVRIIPSGCCGMAGSFGYDKEHYEISQKIGELVLFPAVRKEPEDTIIAASGTSCRHQIKDGTQKQAMHPIEILWKYLKK